MGKSNKDFKSDGDPQPILEELKKNKRGLRPTESNVTFTSGLPEENVDPKEAQEEMRRLRRAYFKGSGLERRG